MLTHDQNEIKTDLTETESVVNEETTSKENVEAVPETVKQDEVEQIEPEAVAVEEPETAQEVSVEEVETLPEPVTEVESAPIEEPVQEEPIVAEEPVVEKAEKKPAKAKEPTPVLSQEEKNHNEMLSMYEKSFSNFQRNQIVEGTVVDVNDRAVMVDIGFKSEGEIPISEFAYCGIPEKNSRINVHINEIENGDGKLILSKKKADFTLNITKIREAFEQGTILNGVIRRRVKGGMIVDVLGIEAFLPGSYMSIKRIPNLDQFIDKEMSFKVVGINEENRNIIVSRKQVMEEEAALKRNELLDRIEIDSELDGEVKNITPYGAFIDLGGIDGLLHLTDMSWGKINHPSEMLNIGDKVKVKVISFDKETSKISLGLKQLVPHPWEHIEIKYPDGTAIKGKVVSVKSFGAFVEIEPGVEGLIHISEMSWTKKITDARKILKIGDYVNAIVLELDKENKRISLGMKQMEPNPWISIDDRYPIGTVVTRKIKSLTAFGAFVEIEDGIDGLIHISDISWTKRIYHPREVYRKNQEVEAIVLSIDRALHRIALGVKQLHPDPWEKLNSMLPVNTEVRGKISKLIPKGVLVDIPLEEDIVEGFIPISHLAIPKLEHSEDAFHTGEELPLKVIELDMENRRLILSVKAFFFSRDPKLQDEYIAIHEQYICERAIKQQKKKAEKEAREKLQKEKEQQDAQELMAKEEADLAVAFDAPVEEQVILEDAPNVEEVAVEVETEEVVSEETVNPEPEIEEVPITETVIEEPVIEEVPAEEIPVEVAVPEEVVPEAAPEIEEVPVAEEVAPEVDPEIEEAPITEEPVQASEDEEEPK